MVVVVESYKKLISDTINTHLPNSSHDGNGHSSHNTNNNNHNDDDNIDNVYHDSLWHPSSHGDKITATMAAMTAACTRGSYGAATPGRQEGSLERKTRCTIWCHSRALSSKRL